MLQVREDGVRVDAVVDETADLVDADLLAPRDHPHRRLRRAEEAGGLVVALERVVEERIGVLGREVLEKLSSKDLPPVGRRLEGREGPTRAAR
ncbi:MAG: hypothetical protein IPG17_20035 [Sandaracinaceae bacterium]|nr:hypothetical protein [Sandaracinaceae bacterium]